MHPLSLQGEWEGPAGAPSCLHLLRMPNAMINFYGQHDSNIMEKNKSKQPKIKSKIKYDWRKFLFPRIRHVIALDFHIAGICNRTVVGS